MNTRERIIYESLKLFSASGFDAVSTRMIARAAEISDTAIYKHFKSKQEIFDTIITICKERFLEKRNTVDIHAMSWDKVEEMCMEMFRFQTEDEWIVLFRRLLVVEQFKNPEMAKLYQSIFIDLPLDSMTAMFEELMKEGYMRKCNARVLAMELYAPFFMYHTLHPQEDRTLEELREHVSYFRKCISMSGVPEIG